MSLWVGNKEVGLAPGQTGGEVRGQQVYRDPTSDISKPYIQAEQIQTTSGYPGDRVLVEAGGQRFYTGRGEVPEIGSYRRETGFTSVRRTGMLSPAEAERQYQEQRGYQPVQQVPSPFQLGYVPYAPGSPFGTGYYASPAYQRHEAQQSPSSLQFEPVKYTPTGYFTSPAYNKMVEGLQAERTQREIKSLLPEGMGLSNFSIGFYKGARNISESVRDKTFTGETQPSLFSSAFPQFAALPYIRESASRLPEFVGTIPGTVEIFGKTAISKPASIPGMLTYGGLAVATGIGKQAEKEPAQLFSDLIVTTGMFRAAGKGFSGIERMRLTSGRATPENVFFPERPGSLGKTPSLLTKPITEMLRFPERERLPQRSAGTEGLELLRMPERPGVSKPIVLESVKTIRESSAIPEQYRAALERGSAPISERGVYGMQFGSKGYRPTGAAKPQNIFTTGEFKRFLKEEKAVSYIPTFERLKAEPQIKTKLQVITAESKGYVLPSLRNLQVVKTTPKTSFKIAVLPQTATRTALMTDILVQTRPKTFTQTMTRTTTRTGLMIEPMTKTMVIPSIMTRVKVMPAIQTRTALKELTQPMTQTATRTQTMTMFDTKKIVKPKLSIDLLPARRKRKGKRSSFKFPELTRVAKPSQIIGNMFAAPKRRKSKTNRKGRKARR